jgi:hypothetical protein
MFTINFKSKPGSRDTNQIKIEMIFYHPGYVCVLKVTNVSGNAKDWDEKTQTFHPNLPATVPKQFMIIIGNKPNMKMYCKV